MVDERIKPCFSSVYEFRNFLTFTRIELPNKASETEQVAALVQKSADLFAEGIAKYPQDWHMMQRIWIDGDFKDRD